MQKIFDQYLKALARTERMSLRDLSFYQEELLVRLVLHAYGGVETSTAVIGALALCPLHLSHPTLAVCIGTSRSCQEETFTAASFDVSKVKRPNRTSWGMLFPNDFYL